MKKVSTLFKILLGFAAGIVSGAFIRLGFEILENRPISVGGEALIIPLIVLLFCFGFSVGKEVKVRERFRWAYQEGYFDGVAQMTREVQHEFFPDTHSKEPTVIIHPGQ